MAKGGHRIGSGRKPKLLGELVQANAFRQDRHGHLLPLARPSPEADRILREIGGEYWRLVQEAKAEVERWTALQAERPSDVKISTQRLNWSRHYQSSLLEVQRRVVQWMATPTPDAFEAFQRRRSAPDDDDAA
jgi:hypothetical protein